MELIEKIGNICIVLFIILISSALAIWLFGCGLDLVHDGMTFSGVAVFFTSAACFLAGIAVVIGLLTGAFDAEDTKK